MKRIHIFLLLLLMLSSHVAIAQEQKPDRSHRPNREQVIAKLKQQRHQYLQNAVGFTQEEAAKFFPLYDKMNERRYQLHRNAQRQIRAIDENDEATSNLTYLEIATMIETLPSQEAEITNEYFQQFKKILPADKLYRYKKAELLFAREMLENERREKPRP